MRPGVTKVGEVSAEPVRTFERGDEAVHCREGGGEGERGEIMVEHFVVWDALQKGEVRRESCG